MLSRRIPRGRHLFVLFMLAWPIVLVPTVARATDQPLAPELRGLGTIHMAVSTANPRAQTFFDQGLRLLYAFNHQEARRAFREAARLDRALAMAYWGQAMALAPNLNAPLTEENARLAYQAVEAARTALAGASPRERALVQALATRFASDPRAPRGPLDRNYAAAMAKMAAAYPRDPDVQTFYADAVMNTMPWDYWQEDGSPKAETATLMMTLERVIANHPDHAGAHHYYIHLLEASETPERAEASADRLGSLMPAAGHIVHMPSHIYIRVGRYADAADINLRAIAADEDYLAQCQRQGLYPVSYYPHNLHFLWAAATFEGRGAVAIDAARRVASKVPHHHAGALAWTADFPVTPWLAYVRFGRWQEILTEPTPPVSEPYATGIWHYARGLAFIARNQTARAQEEIAALVTVMNHEAFRTTLKDLPLLTNLEIASRIVRGELAARAGQQDRAIELVSEAVTIEDTIPYNEPPVWHQPTRQVLGALLLEAGRAREAEKAYREDLGRFRENGWSLFGLWQSLSAQGRTDEARAVRARFDKAWARADITLTSSRVLRVGESDRMPAPTPKARSAEEHTIKAVALETGVTLEYVERGSTSGVPVVFLHGVTDSWRSFELLLPHLPDAVRAFAVTQRGHGDATRPAQGYGYRDFSEDVRAFMDVLQIRSAVIVGHSMGSLVARRFAIDHPGRTLGLVLMGSFTTLRGHAGVQELWDSAVSTLTDPIDPGFVKEFQKSTLARDVAPEYFEAVVGESLKVPAHVWRATFKTFLETPDFSDAATITAPTLILWGDQDAFSPRQQQQALRMAIPGARLVVYDGAGHGLHWEDPERVAADLVAFIQEIHGSRRVPVLLGE